MHLHQKILAAIDADRVLVSWHADDQCEHRKVAPWQIIAGAKDAEVLHERPRSKPNPSLLMRQTLADGTTVHTVWSWLNRTGRAKLVTVFFDDD